MNKIKNVFLVHTEYHLLQSVNLAVNLYNSPNVINTIYIDKKTRLRGLSDVNNYIYKNIKIIILKDILANKVVDIILEENMDHFFFFQESSPYNLYICYKLAQRNVEISLGPDGYKPYA